MPFHNLLMLLSPTSKSSKITLPQLWKQRRILAVPRPVVALLTGTHQQVEIGGMCASLTQAPEVGQPNNNQSIGLHRGREILTTEERRGNRRATTGRMAFSRIGMNSSG